MAVRRSRGAGAQLLVRNRDLLDGMEARARAIRRHGRCAAGMHCAAIPARGSRRNIAAHYDLGNEFFSLFLSPDLMYSSAIWDGAGRYAGESHRLRKLERICRKLDLKPTDRVVEIGTGWGGFALHAAQARRLPRHDHHDLARATRAGQRARRGTQAWASASTCCSSDYRDLAGRYDKLVSIEMIEAIGAPYLDGVFRAARRVARSPTASRSFRPSPSRIIAMRRRCNPSITSSGMSFPEASSLRSMPC